MTTTTPKRTLTGAALAAKCIREELKTLWPTIKFKVTSKKYAGGSSVYVSWDMGPTSRQVDAITRKYQHGHFDGMTDCYEHHATGTPASAKFVFAERGINDDMFNRIAKDYAALLGIEYEGYHSRFQGEMIGTLTHQLTSQFDFTQSGYQGVRRIQGVKVGTTWADFYELIGATRIARY